MVLAQPSAERGLQLRRSGTASAAAAAAAAAASAGDADVPGRLGDRSDGDLPGSAATAAPAAPGRFGRARKVSAAEAPARLSWGLQFS